MKNAEQKKKTPYAHLFRLSHWVLSAGMLFLIFTGYGIHSVGMPSWSVLDNYPSFYPSMRMIYWHEIAGILFAPASIIALFIFLRRVGPRLNNPRKAVNMVLICAGVVCSITSIGIIYSDVPAILYHTCRFLHAACGMVLAPLALLTHILLALFKYYRLIVSSFAPFRQQRWIHAVWLMAGIAVSWGFYTGYAPDVTGMNILAAGKADRMVSRIEEADLLPWDRAKPLKFQLTNGVGFDHGITRASIRALYNSRYVYLKVQWTDATYNRLYRPWIKTDSGWMHLNPGGSDEKIYNEDKIALLFPISENPDFRRYGCSIYCHNNQNYRFGQHWTPSESIVDIWHWKSVRTDPFGHIDDKYWQGVGEVKVESEARHGDPGESGYYDNKVEGIDNPIMLPTGLDSIMLGGLVKTKAGIYTKDSAAALPRGAAVPGIIISETKGDRADIHCRSSYRDGTWTLYIMRRMDTGSPYDIPFEPGGTYDFAMAAFDHSSFRHAYNHRTYRLHFIQ